MKQLSFIALLATLCSPIASWTFAEDVVTIERCGETVEAGRTAYLITDLDCRGTAAEGIVMRDHARLVMSGHTMLGDPNERRADGTPLQGVRCEAGSVCTVEGPGAVVGFSASGIAGTRVRVRDVYLARNGIAGVSAFENVRLRSVAIAENGAAGVRAGGRVHTEQSDLESQAVDPVVAMHAPAIRPACSSED